MGVPCCHLEETWPAWATRSARRLLEGLGGVYLTPESASMQTAIASSSASSSPSTAFDAVGLPDAEPFLRDACDHVAVSRSRIRGQAERSGIEVTKRIGAVFSGRADRSSRSTPIRPRRSPRSRRAVRVAPSDEKCCFAWKAAASNAERYSAEARWDQVASRVRSATSLRRGRTERRRVPRASKDLSRMSRRRADKRVGILTTRSGSYRFDSIVANAAPTLGGPLVLATPSRKPHPSKGARR
jgi:hypothetical protein